MPQPQKLPDPTGWRFVLVHRFARHGSPIQVSGYEETARSFPSLHHGVVKPTVVLRSQHVHQRAMKLGGWEDITAEVGPQTPKCWDEERERWKLDPEGLLPWERKPGEKVAPIPVVDEKEAASREGEEIPLDPPKEKVSEAPAPTQAKQPMPKPSSKKPSTRPKS